jgi:hypothetical protein
MNVEMLKIAIDAVAASHTEGHECDVCKASRGDQDAFGRIALEAFAEEVGEMRGPRGSRRTERWRVPQTVVTVL